MRMFNHCIDLFEEHFIYNLIDTPHKLQFVCGFMGVLLNLSMNIYYNGFDDTLTSWITPPWFGMFYIGKSPIWIYCLMVIIGYCIAECFTNWWVAVHIDINNYGKKRWCKGKYLETYEYVGEQKID